MSESVSHEKKRKSREDGEKKKSKKRKVDEVETNGVAIAEDVKSAEKKREKKRKREQAEDGVQEVTPNLEESEKPKKKSKKSKKSKGEQTDTGEVAKEPTPTDEVAPVGETHEQDEGIVAPLEPQGEPEVSVTKKKSKKSKKNKAEDAGAVAKDSKPTDQIAPVGETHEQDESIVAPLEIVGQPAEEVKANGASDKKLQKQKKQKKSKTPATEATDHPSAAAAKPTANGEAEQQSQEQIGRKGERFIVFVGNLPFSATKDTITAHFKKVEPADVRLMTHKDSGKSKGFAFLEFEKYDRMRTCLKLYHHSVFDDGTKKGRKINVELT